MNYYIKYSKLEPPYHEASCNVTPISLQSFLIGFEPLTKKKSTTRQFGSYIDCQLLALVILLATVLDSD